MLADLDLLLTAVFAAADDLLPERRKNARRSVTDAEVVTLAVAQAVMDIPSDREFIAVARRRWVHLFPRLPGQPGYWKVIKAQDQHLKDAVAHGDGVHDPALKEMQGRWKHRISGMGWYRKAKRDFAALPEDSER